ncbi:MAG: hypothetical protein JHC93_07070 [Parachlamydiales bacterium]|nr:hypothetical protein [Parachlamydiales bacterium]
MALITDYQMISKDCWEHILSYTTPEQVAALTSLSTFFKSIISTDNFWENQMHFPKFIAYKHIKQSKIGFKPKIRQIYQTKITALITANKNWIVAGDSDGKVIVWDLTTLKLINTLDYSKSSISALASNEKNLFSGDYEGQISIWDLNPLKHLKQIKLSFFSIKHLSLNDQFLFATTRNVDIFVFSADGMDWKKTFKFLNTDLFLTSKKIVISDENKNICIADLTLFKENYQINFSKITDLYSSCMTASDHFIFFGDCNKILKFDNLTNKFLSIVFGHNDTIFYMQTIDNKLLLSASVDNILKFHDIATGECLWSMLASFDNSKLITYSSDCGKLIFKDSDISMTIFDYS